MAWIDDDHLDFLEESGIEVSIAEYYYLANVANMQKSKTYNFWCVAPNSFFARKMRMKDKGLRLMQGRLVAKGLLEKGAGTRKRATPLFTDFKINSVESADRYKVPSNSVESTDVTRYKVPINSVESTDKIEERKKKVKESKSATLILPFSSKEFQEAWEIWGQHRKEKRQKLTATTIKLQFKQLTEMGEVRAIKALIHSAKNGYTGIFEDKADKAKRQQQASLTKKITNSADAMREMYG